MPVYSWLYDGFTTQGETAAGNGKWYYTSKRNCSGAEELNNVIIC